MLDHVGIPVSDFMRSKGFYLQVLRRWDMISCWRSLPRRRAAIATPASGRGRPQFWIGTGKPITGPGAFCLHGKGPRRRAGLP